MRTSSRYRLFPSLGRHSRCIRTSTTWFAQVWCESYTDWKLFLFIVFLKFFKYSRCFWRCLRAFHGKIQRNFCFEDCCDQSELFAYFFLPGRTIFWILMLQKPNHRVLTWFCSAYSKLSLKHSTVLDTTSLTPVVQFHWVTLLHKDRVV